MSEQRNADKDREQLNELMITRPDTMPLYNIILHWLERAVAAEQRVTDLENSLRAIIIKCEGAGAYTTEAYVHLYAFQALKGGTE